MRHDALTDDLLAIDCGLRIADGLHDSLHKHAAIGGDVAGLTVFPSLAEAIKAGYQVYDRTRDGYLVRTRTAAGWAIAVVVVRRAVAPAAK